MRIIAELVKEWFFFNISISPNNIYNYLNDNQSVYIKNRTAVEVAISITDGSYIFGSNSERGVMGKGKLVVRDNRRSKSFNRIIEKSSKSLSDDK